ncbi:uncharacterized protein LOC113356629 [Papaver somniferum]|uniref:uncharacterized protein LOC113356629 n=1 Tax=Papaver somniferum TaxID=3469 RepID=UPI000E7057D1|nr:uncharacterized protein LOC113356629 [Papaver somniferum]
MAENEIDVELKSISLDLVDLSSIRESIQNSSTPSATDGDYQGGKPFNSDDKSDNDDVDCQVSKVTNSEHHTSTAEMKNYENPYYLKELFYLQNKLHSQDYSYLLVVDIRSLYDRGLDSSNDQGN